LNRAVAHPGPFLNPFLTARAWTGRGGGRIMPPMRLPRPFLPALLLLSCLAAPARAFWVTAYYPGWRQKHLPPGDIDFAAITHLVHFSVVPRADGTLDADVNMLTPENRAAAVAAAHGAGRKILLAVGGQDSREPFLGAMSDAHRAAFIARLVRFMREGRYDGLDVDMEELKPGDGALYARFIKDLRRALDRVSPRPLLTAPVLWEAPLFAKLAKRFDQVNIMSYNVSGPYPGWVSWHSEPLYDGGARFPDGKAPLPSLDGLVSGFLQAGVPKTKLGAGMSFIGYVWTGGEVDGPRQAWSEAPVVKLEPYFALADEYGLEEDAPCAACRWDESAQAAYLSVDGPERRFVSYGDRVAAGRTVDYARRRGLGGLIIWDIAAGYRPGLPPGRRDLLLQAVKKAAVAGAEL
jgi:chitinase